LTLPAAAPSELLKSYRLQVQMDIHEFNLKRTALLSVCCLRTSHGAGSIQS
jgi:hypothetical protein